MIIAGLQKMTLLDYPGVVACTVFLPGCDLRCPYCHNYELATGKAAPVMEEEEFFDFLGARKGRLEGVAVSGGEPCLHPDLPAFLARIRGMGYRVKLDTNGMHPEMLRQILAEGLADYVAMDIKNAPAKYAQTTGVEGLDPAPAKESARMLIESGTEYEFRTTVVRELHTAEDFHGIGEMIRGAKRYFLQSFTDRETVPYSGLHAPTPEEMEQYRAIAAEYVSEASLRGLS
ncbi:MAG: anaerobic ribonucleoside-triphosphate reductase activating protein [Lachnospiraceae bacterium]|nr:anaerobic ribonucleoside-triphosphate reductase activating protein [Lachnospiraceae bacterium]